MHVSFFLRSPRTLPWFPISSPLAPFAMGNRDQRRWHALQTDRNGEERSDADFAMAGLSTTTRERERDKDRDTEGVNAGKETASMKNWS